MATFFLFTSFNFSNATIQEPVDSMEYVNVIIAPQEWYETASILANYHTSRGILTTVANTSWIYSNYEAAEDPPFTGYADRFLVRFFIRDYDYVLAKKIITFLRDSTYHPNLEYITLLGSGEIIPASYYLYSPFRTLYRVFDRLVPSIYNNRIATDFFYTSPNYDLWPNFKVGRLPVSTEQQAAHVINKIITWQENVEWEWFQNAYLAGDHPDHPEEMDLDGCYVGEMIIADAINNNYFQGMNCEKLFWTEDRFYPKDVLEVLEQGDAGFLYVITHGSIDRWYFVETNPLFIQTNDVLNIPENKNLPVVVSVACMVGAYDTMCAQSFGFSRGNPSLGQSILLSEGAGIAYVGTTRATLGSPQLYLDNGEVVITKQRGIAGLLNYFFSSYHQGYTRLGDISYNALKSYVNDNVFGLQPGREEAFAVLVSYVVLGDPVLELPEQQINTRPSYTVPSISALNPEGMTSETYSRPWYSHDSTIEFYITTTSPTISIKIIDIHKDLVVFRDSFELIDPLYSYNPEETGRYLIRAIGDDGKEGWLYFTVQY